MPKSCCVFSCTNNKAKNSELSFYLVPSRATEPERRLLWLRAINRGTQDAVEKLWEPKSDYTYVCSAHFVSGKKNNAKDHPDYVPSIFPHIIQSASPRKRKLHRFLRAQQRKDMRDFIVATKVESEFLDRSCLLDKDLIVKVKVESEFEDDSMSQKKGSVVFPGASASMSIGMPSFSFLHHPEDEAQVVKSQTFQNNLLHTSQDALSNDHVKQEPCDSPPTGPSKAAQLLEEKQMNLDSCSNCSLLFNTQVFNRHVTQTVTQEAATFNSVSCKYCTETLKNIQGILRPQKCSVCGKSFTTSSSLKRHQGTHLGEKPYKCALCPSTFVDSTHLKNHLRVHNGEKPHKCSVCDKSFTMLSSSKRHQTIHTGEKPFKCSTCRKEFARSSDLRVHQRTHTGDKPYKCSLCPKAFIQSSHFRSHQRTHTGEKPHKCSLCPKAFAHSSNLRNHQKVHTGERPHKCSVCDKSFTMLSSLKRHQTI